MTRLTADLDAATRERDGLRVVLEMTREERDKLQAELDEAIQTKVKETK